ncbi:hypothetical protein WDV91_01390 [Curtobacterium flaccumfaciens pv. flaccumfaciens]
MLVLVVHRDHGAQGPIGRHEPPGALSHVEQPEPGGAGQSGDGGPAGAGGEGRRTLGAVGQGDERGLAGVVHHDRSVGAAHDGTGAGDDPAGGVGAGLCGVGGVGRLAVRVEHADRVAVGCHELLAHRQEDARVDPCGLVDLALAQRLAVEHDGLRPVWPGDRRHGLGRVHRDPAAAVDRAHHPRLGGVVVRVVAVVDRP